MAFQIYQNGAISVSLTECPVINCSTTIIVYQAYNSAIGQFAVAQQQLGGEFDYGRMSWIKMNFLWMMHRSGWSTKDNQQVILALRLRREFFETLLAQAVSTTCERERFATQEAWTNAARQSPVRVQWDPDYDPWGILSDAARSRLD